MNIQFAIQGEDIYVLEVNPRASRTVPFVSKATGLPLAKIAALDRSLRRIAEARDPRRGLSPIDSEDIVLLNLQRAVHTVIDLAAHAVATEGYGLPDKLAMNFTLRT